MPDEEIHISQLKFDENNANLGTPRGQQVIEDSIQKLGFGRSILVDKNLRIIAGNKSAMTAGGVGFEDVIIVPSDGTKIIAVQRTDLDLSKDAKAKELAVSDNRSSELSLSWDAQVLAELNQEVDLSWMFKDEELTELLEQLNSDPHFAPPSEEEDEESTAELLEKADAGEIESRFKLGEIIRLGRHVICCGDSTVEANVRKLLSYIGGREPDMVWSDSPYGVKERTNRKSAGRGKLAECNDFAPIIGDENTLIAQTSFRLCTSMFPKAIQIWWGANYFPEVLPPMPSWIVWDKRDGVASDDNADCELAWSNYGKPARVFRHLWKGMIKASERTEKRVHPSQKPSALPEFCFTQWGEPGDLVFDPFLGSAPSILAAQKMDDNRTVVGFELSPAYIEVIAQRYQQFTGEDPIVIGAL